MNNLNTAIKWHKLGINCLQIKSNSKYVLKGTRLDNYKELQHISVVLKYFANWPGNIATFPAYSEIIKKYLVILDFDFLPSYLKFEHKDTLTTSTKHGYHCYFWCDKQPDKKLRCEDEKIEIKYHMPVMIPPSKIRGFEYSDNGLLIKEIEKIENVIATYRPTSSVSPVKEEKVETIDDLWQEIENSVNFSSFTWGAARSAADKISIFQSIKCNLTILEYLSIISDDRLVSIPCPMHQDNKPSLAVNCEDNICKCFKQSCPLSHQWFDVIGLHAALKGLSNIEAAKELLKDYCI